MNLYDYLDAINIELDIKRHPNQDNRWTASFNDCEVKDDCFLRGAYGDKHSPTEAINDYLRQIRGKSMVKSAMHLEFRREFVVPKQIQDVHTEASNGND